MTTSTEENIAILIGELEQRTKLINIYFQDDPNIGNLGVGRELSLVKTKLQEARLWAEELLRCLKKNK